MNDRLRPEAFSRLPLIKINTQNTTIPGYQKSVTYDNVYRQVHYAPSDTGETTIPASMEVFDAKGGNCFEDEPVLTSKINIRVRGRSSRAFHKSSYAVRMVNADGSNNPNRLLGMDAHHEWVLHGPYLDKTYIKNYFFYNLAGEFSGFAPNARFCELSIDGSYQGLYVAVETITCGKYNTRIPLEVSKKNNTFSGYIVRLDDLKLSADQDTDRQIVPFSQYTERSESDMEIVYPGKTNLTPVIRRKIEKDVSDFEKMLYSYDFSSPNGYISQINMDSFVDTWLINEISMNYDFGGLSTYLYKGLDGRYGMCVWDFNNTCNFYEEPLDTDRLDLADILWYNMLFRDPAYTERTISRYKELRLRVLANAAIDEKIDKIAAYTKEAAARDEAIWNEQKEPGNGLLQDPDTPTQVDAAREPAAREDAIEQMKHFLHRRLKWLDSNIESLRQYCSSSAAKKYRADRQ